MRKVEYWQWRYRDPKTGRMCRTRILLTEEQAAKYPQAERIGSTMLLLAVDEPEFEETTPGVRQPKEPD